MSCRQPSERTPLLQPPADSHGDESIIQEDDIQVAEVVGQGALEAPQFPAAGKRKSYSHSHWLAPDEDSAARPEPEDPAEFRENGLLAGVTRTQFRFVFGGILLGYFIAMFDSTLMSSSHPVITSYFNASNSASWLSTAFLLTSTSLQPLFGRVSDTIGRRPLYLFGLLFLAATTAWCALAQSIGSFIAARAFCGLGAAGVLSMGNIMTNDLVSIQVRGTYQAYINLFYGGGSAAGAAFGGFLCDKIGWRMTFAIQIPMIIIILINAYFTTPTTLGPNLAKHSGQGIRDAMKGFDIAGSVLLTGSVAFLILGLNLGGNVYPWRHPLVITSLVVASLAGTLLVRVESKAARPVMPLQMLFTKPRGNLVFNNFFAQLGINTIIFNAPLYFQAVKLESASMSGFRLAGPSLALTICGVSAGFIMTATGRMTWLIVVGSLFMLLGGIGLSVMWEDIPTWLATIFLVPASIGQGLSFPAASVAVLATSTQADQAVMTSTLILWRSLGIVMGVSFSSVILQNALTAYLEQLVTGHHKDEIVLTVRKSVRSIIDLDPKHQSQGMCFRHRLYWFFSFCTPFAVSAVVIWKLPPITLLRRGGVSNLGSAGADPVPSTQPRKLTSLVIDAYGRSLRLTFISAIAVFVVVNVLVVGIKLPPLKIKETQVEETDDASTDN